MQTNFNSKYNNACECTSASPLWRSRSDTSGIDLVARRSIEFPFPFTWGGMDHLVDTILGLTPLADVVLGVIEAVNVNDLTSVVVVHLGMLLVDRPLFNKIEWR